jgi:hypothetical protein
MHFKVRRHTINFISILVVCLAFFFSTLQISFAVGDTFTTRTLIGGDTTPPTVPGSFTATPIAQTQIDLSWAPSSDDWALAGYRVWRDDVNIATTTLTTYSDSGLTSSTTYLYYVTAYDTSSNQSASSSPVSTTTLDVPVVLPPDSGDAQQYGSRLHPMDDMIVSFQVLPGKNAVKLLYETSSYVRSSILWGEGESYELGSLLEDSYRKRHESYISELLPNTSYSFRIVGEDAHGRTGEMYRGVFTTLPVDDIFPPSNVWNFTAIFENDDVVLSWINPDDTDFKKVRILRSELFYPYDEADGWVVYEGNGTQARDTGMKDGKRHFYTIFSYDELGNMSSGAVVFIDSGTTTTDTIDVTKNISGLSFEDITFVQDGDTLVHDGSRVLIDGSRQLTISIPYSRLPEHLKTILVRVQDARDSQKTFEFLLRVNAEKTLYTGTLAPFGVAGDFPVTVAVFDYTTAQIGYTNGVLASSIRPIHTETGAGMSEVWPGWIYFLSTSLLLIILLLVRRRLVHIHG